MIKLIIIIIIIIIAMYGTSVHASNFQDQNKEQISKYNIELKEKDNKNKKYDNIKTNTVDILNTVFSIQALNDITFTMMGKYIQNNEIVKERDLNKKESYTYVDTKKMHLKGKEELNYTKTVKKNNCLIFKNENVILKFCNFINIEDIKIKNKNFFKFYFYKIKDR